MTIGTSYARYSVAPRVSKIASCAQNKSLCGMLRAACCSTATQSLGSTTVFSTKTIKLITACPNAVMAAQSPEPGAMVKTRAMRAIVLRLSAENRVICSEQRAVTVLRTSCRVLYLV